MPAALAVLTALILLATGCTAIGGETAPAPGSPARAELEKLLTTVRIVDSRGHPGGYERGCKAGQGCVFGPAWSDDQDAPRGHDGCDTRNNVLGEQLSGVVRKGDCVVVSGTLDDPYTGKRIDFTKSDAKDIQIDHVYPLAAAWDMGASGWGAAQRLRFANDVEVNLLAVAAKANQDKGDRTPGDWLPPSRAGHCFYAGKYLTVAVRYELPLTAADRDALARVARTCP
ncbi:HNH endonuclease family protein [Nocardia yamanashiensis]|uniref:HNH endonuclease family protein n=1 Tax=Nocardia yamanashiensis TaxID=209247 RepID=UPI000A05617E